MKHIRELLEAAAKAGGIDAKYIALLTDDDPPSACWNSLASNGDALELAARLDLTVCTQASQIHVSYRGEILASSGKYCEDLESKMSIIRHTITRAAAYLTLMGRKLLCEISENPVFAGDTLLYTPANDTSPYAVRVVGVTQFERMSNPPACLDGADGLPYPVSQLSHVLR